MNRFIIPVLLIMTSFWSIQAQNKKSLTLEEAIAIAIEENFGVNLARKDVAIASHNNTLGNAGLLPTVSINGSYIRNVNNVDYTISNFNNPAFGNIEISDNNIGSSVFSTEVYASYPIVQGGKGRNLLKRLNFLQHIGDQELKLAIEQTIVDVTTAYFNVSRKYNLMRIAEEGTSISKQRYAHSKDAYSIGHGSLLEMLQNEVDLKNDSLLLQDTKLDYQAGKRELNVLLSKQPTTPIEISNAIPSFEMLPPLNDLISSGLIKNTSLKILETDLQIRGSTIEIAKSARFPKIDAFARYGYGYRETDLGQFLKAQEYGPAFGLIMTQTVFSGSRLNSKIKNARFEKEKSKIQLSQFKLSLTNTITHLYQEHKNTLEKLRIAKENATVSNTNYLKAKDEHRNGNINITTLREAQLNLIKIRNSIIEFKYLIKTNEVRLLQLAGML